MREVQDQVPLVFSSLNLFVVDLNYSVIVVHTDQTNLSLSLSLSLSPSLSHPLPPQMRFLLLFSRQGKLRLQKWFVTIAEREKKKVIRDMTSMVLARKPRSCNFLHWRDLKIVYKRLAHS